MDKIIRHYTNDEVDPEELSVHRNGQRIVRTQPVGSIYPYVQDGDVLVVEYKWRQNKIRMETGSCEARQGEGSRRSSL